jgi:hypothetical protein
MMSIDDRFLAEWVQYGLNAFAEYLQKHARFEAYLESREAPPPRGRRSRAAKPTGRRPATGS